jgi:cysteine desulfurase
MDNAATTAVFDEVIESMLPFFKDQYGNPSSVYGVGKEAKKAIENSREIVANCINACAKEIYFTSGGSESDNWAIKGTAYSEFKKGKNHIITSKIEHHAVLHVLERLSRCGFEVTFLDVNDKGLIDPKDVENAIRPETSLVTIMYANNEIGTIQPIKEIGRICREKKVLFHTDAVQAIGNVHVDVQDQNIDLLSLSAHKFHGPKGVGVLYVKKGITMQNLIDGGAQEKGLRAGTENVPGIVGLSTAMQIACSSIDERNEKLSRFRDKIIFNLSKIESSRLNGDPEKRLPGNVNMCFEGIEGESMLLMLDAKGICASSGSACTSGSLDPSHVLLAIGLEHEIAHGSLRITLGDQNTQEEVDYLLEVLPSIIEKLRSMSPVWNKERVMPQNG